MLLRNVKYFCTHAYVCVCRKQTRVLLTFFCPFAGFSNKQAALCKRDTDLYANGSRLLQEHQRNFASARDRTQQFPC